MTTKDQTAEYVEQQPRTLRRRGLIAGAAALVAGMISKRTAEPASANDATWTLPYTGTYPAHFETAVFTIINSDSSSGIKGIYGSSANGTGIFGTCGNANFLSPDGTGVFGTSSIGVGHGVHGKASLVGVMGEAFGPDNSYGVYGSGLTGVYGTSSIGNGVYGLTVNANGVEGRATGDAGTGVFGNCLSTYGTGVQGLSTGGTGVYGLSSNSIGVYGNSSNSVGVYGLTVNASGVEGRATGDAGTGVFGNCLSANGTGVNGASTGGIGVYGNSSNSYGVVGYTTGGSASLSGISTNANIPAFAGGNSVAGGLAASFSGTVYVNGQFVVADMTQKHGLLRHPDGSHRLMYTVEAPESWAEDFGTGTLAGGRAEVKMDADFAALVHTEDYHVFLTPHADTNGLHVTQRGSASFVVQEHKGGTASLTFSWRVVAKPKTDKKVERLGKFTIPNVKYPDPATLPKPVDAKKKP